MKHTAERYAQLLGVQFLPMEYMPEPSILHRLECWFLKGDRQCR